MIQNIEGVRAEHQTAALTQRELARYREVNLRQAKSWNVISSFGSLPCRAGNAESSGVQDLSAWRLVTGNPYRLSCHAVRTSELLRQRAARQTNARVERKSSPDIYQSVERPVVCEVGQKCKFLRRGQDIRDSAREIVPRVEIRGSVVILRGDDCVRQTYDRITGVVVERMGIRVAQKGLHAAGQWAPVLNLQRVVIGPRIVCRWEEQTREVRVGPEERRPPQEVAAGLSNVSNTYGLLAEERLFERQIPLIRARQL